LFETAKAQPSRNPFLGEAHLFSEKATVCCQNESYNVNVTIYARWRQNPKCILSKLPSPGYLPRGPIRLFSPRVDNRICDFSPSSLDILAQFW